MKRARHTIWGSIAGILWMLCAAILAMLVMSEFRQYNWGRLLVDQKSGTWNLIQVEIGHDKIAFVSTLGPAKPPQVRSTEFPLLFPAIILATAGYFAFREYRAPSEPYPET